MKSALGALKAAGGGSIVNVSSTAGMEGVAGGSAYGIEQVRGARNDEAAALEFGRYGIRVNSVHPGGIDTVMARRRVRGLRSVVDYAACRSRIGAR